MLFVGIAATACALAAPAAHAFTVENKDAAGQYGVPKFDLEEQIQELPQGRRRRGFDDGKSLYETPLGNGTLHFGVQQGPVQLRLGVQLRPRPVGLRATTRVRSSTAALAPPTSLEYNGVR